MNDKEIQSKLLAVSALAADYCSALENARDSEKADFVAEMLDYLPRLYWHFSDLVVEEDRKSVV